MTPEDYLIQVRDLLNCLGEVLSNAELSEVEHLIKHDEPAEGLRTLAWIIHDEKKSVPKEIVGKILSLTKGMIAEEDLPPDFKASL